MLRKEWKAQIMEELEKLREILAQHRRYTQDKSLREIGQAAIKAEMKKLAEPLKR